MVPANPGSRMSEAKKAFVPPAHAAARLKATTGYRANAATM